MHQPGIFLQIDEENIALGFGPLTRSSHPSQTLPSFYLNDFFLTQKTPWILPQSFEILSLQEARSLFSAKENPPLAITWREISLSSFQRTFTEVQEMIQRGDLQKGVPVIFEEGEIQDLPPDLFFPLAVKLFSTDHPHMYLYGYTDMHEGMIGCTPELLFDTHGLRLSTAALAGTQGKKHGASSLYNEKDLEEHQLVVQDLHEKLSPLGRTQIHQRTTQDIGSLLHLRTTLETHLDRSLPFEKIVTTLHPTAALGVYPCTPAAISFLHADHDRSPRRYFGAPFGILFPDGRGRCLVSIRCIQWIHTAIRIGSGCGIVAQSDLFAEFEELRLKRESVKERFFGDTP